MKTEDRETRKGLQRAEPGLLDEMDRAFDAFLRRGWMRPLRDLWPDWAPMQPGLELAMPRVDLIDREDEVLVRAELPGVTKDDLKVELVGDLLTIAGERRHEEKVEQGNVFRAEIGYGSVSRTLRMPVEVNPDQVTASFENGMLEVHLPKQATAKRQKIEVK